MLEDLHTQTFVTDRRSEQEQYVSSWTGMGGDIINSEVWIFHITIKHFKLTSVDLIPIVHSNGLSVSMVTIFVLSLSSVFDVLIRSPNFNLWFSVI
jgi:hypothetical protein